MCNRSNKLLVELQLEENCDLYYLAKEQILQSEIGDKIGLINGIFFMTP